MCRQKTGDCYFVVVPARITRSLKMVLVLRMLMTFTYDQLVSGQVNWGATAERCVDLIFPGVVTAATLHIAMAITPLTVVLVDIPDD